MSVTWGQALSWRMRRQLLDPPGGGSVPDVVRRLCAVPATPAAGAELAVRTRLAASEPGAVQEALEQGDLVKVYAFRGATHLLTSDDGGAYLALRCASRMWELASWRSHYRLEPSDWPALRAAVRQALADGPLTASELGREVTAHAAFAHLAPTFADGAHTLIKPLMWQGVMAFGASREGQATFCRLDRNPRWAGLPELDEAGTHAVLAYLRGYGPSTADHLHHWLGEGLGAGRRRITRWLAAVRDQLVEVDVDGVTTLVHADDVEDLRATRPGGLVRLLPAYDPWVLGPGTADPHVVPPARRALVTRGAAVVVRDGVVSGTWSATPDRLAISWFAEAGDPPRAALEAEATRTADLLGRPLSPAVGTAPAP